MSSPEPLRAVPEVATPQPQSLLDLITHQLAAEAEEYDRSAEFPRKTFDLLAQHGLIGFTVPRRYGGSGAGLLESLRVLSAVAKGEPSTALILFMTYVFHAAAARERRWPSHLYERVAREAVAGSGLIGALRVEPELGTPMRGGLPKTVARRTAGGWRITGNKIYSTGSTGLSWYAVWAKTDEVEPRVGVFLVAADTTGIAIVPAWDHLGMRATVSHEVVFENTLVPFDHAVDIRAPAEWTPRPGDPVALWNALAIATIYDGVAQAARDWLRDYLRKRQPSNLGAPLSTLPRVQEKFGEIEALLYTNRVLIGASATRHEQGRSIDVVEANYVKYVATGNAIHAVELGLELTGNPGLSRKNPLERHYRDVLCSRIHSPQNDAILMSGGASAFAL